MWEAGGSYIDILKNAFPPFFSRDRNCGSIFLGTYKIRFYYLYRKCGKIIFIFYAVITNVYWGPMIALYLEYSRPYSQV